MRGHKVVIRLLVDRDDVEADSKDGGGRTPIWLFEPPIRQSARLTAKAFEPQSPKEVPPLLLATSLHRTTRRPDR
jgi:hypothetical protein